MQNHPSEGGVKTQTKMKQIKLEVGKTYRDREGKEVEIIRKDDNGRPPYQGDNGVWYTESGRCGVEDPDDLIEEVPETRHTFAIPNGVKKVTVEQLGNRIVVEMVPEEGPKAGDVMVNENGSVYILKEAISKNMHNYFAWLGSSGRLVYNNSAFSGRPATPEEAQPLWDALKKAGKRWNAEAMKVEDVPEIERIREWLRANFDYHLYAQGDVVEAIEAYLKYREGKK